MSNSLQLTIDVSKAQELLDILDAADKWIQEFKTYCDPKDFDLGYADRLYRTSASVHSWRVKLLTIIPSLTTP